MEEDKKVLLLILAWSLTMTAIALILTK